MAAVVLLNDEAGAAQDGDARGLEPRVADAFAAAGMAVEVKSVPPGSLTPEAQAAGERCDVVVAAGGDGTVRSVAEGVRRTGAALAVLPLGTFNHFAKELEMPLALQAAANAIARGVPDALPVGEVNGSLFLSFVATGMHARAVRHRLAQQRARERGKLMAMIVALAHVIRRPPLRRYRFDGGDQVLRRHSLSLIVATNQYQLEAVGLKQGSAEERCRLNVCVARPQSAWGVLRMVLHAWLGRAREDFEVFPLEEVVVSTGQQREHAVIDGELETLEMPLRMRILPTPLRVLRPPTDLREKPTRQISAR